MTQEEREQQFRDYIDICINKRRKEYVGLGNPFAKILLIGQEPAQAGEANERIKTNIKDITDCLNNGDLKNLYYQDCFYHDRKDNSGRPVLNRTWSAYQKLIDYIRPDDKRWIKCAKTDFCKDVFTTEINNTVSLRQARERHLRLDTLRESEFIQGFPVIVLACGPYIHNRNGVRQIDDTFKVRYDGDENGRFYCSKSKSKWFCTHHSSDNRRLVIHTIQLSQYSDQLLYKMAEKIRNHFEENGESYFPISY